MKKIGLSIASMLMLLTTIACTICGAHIYQNVDYDRCQDYMIEDPYSDNEFPYHDGGRRQLEHQCGSWLGFAITMLVDAGLWLLSTILSIIFIFRYSKFDSSSGEEEGMNLSQSTT